MNLFKGLRVAALATIVFLSGCNNESQPQNTQRTLTYDFENTKSAWLRDHLPDQTMAYMSMPTPWNYFFDPKADAMHSAQDLSVFKQQATLIKQGFKTRYFKHVPTAYQPLVGLAFEHIQSPLELAFLNGSESGLLPNFAVATQLINVKKEELKDKIQRTFEQSGSGLSLETDDAGDVWKTTVNGSQLIIRYDDNSGKLLVFGGMAARLKVFNQLWSEPTGPGLEKIVTLDKAADPSGLNLKFWAASSRIYNILKAFAPADQRVLLEQMGMSEMEYVWFGTESARGRSALALHVLMPETGWRLFTPRSNGWFDVEMAGKPRFALQLAFPTQQQFEDMIKTFKKDPLAADEIEFKEFKQVQQLLDIGISEVLGAYEQQMYLVKDQSGTWGAIKIKDSTKHQVIVEKLKSFFKITPNTQTLNGVSINEAHFSSMQQFALASIGDSSSSKAQKEIDDFFSIFKDHIYWKTEDDVIYFSSVPQILAEKDLSKNSMMLSQWLKDSQDIDWQNAIFSYAKEVNYLPQDIYNTYLLIVQSLGDLAGVHVDLFALPTANELKLPSTGRMNIGVYSSTDQFSVKFAYEYSVLEGFLNIEAGIATVAAVGIIAAYAIPAYKDYTVRAKLGEYFALSSSVKMAVAEYWVANDTFEGIGLPAEIPQMSYSIDESTGTITIDLDGFESFGPGDEIYFEPNIDENGIEWTCYASIEDRYLPSSCRY